MLRYAGKQLINMALTLIAVSMLVFLLNEWTPGDVVSKLLGPYASQDQVDKVTREMGLDRASHEPGVAVFHAATRKTPEGAVVTSGGRVLGVTATAERFEEARKEAYRAVDLIHFSNRYFRNDIGEDAVAFERRARDVSPPPRRKAGGAA